MSKELNPQDFDKLLAAGDAFVANWTAHENKLSASFSIFKNRIIVVRVNESVANASGCSIDKLTRFIKSAELSFGVELMNRLLVAYKNGDDVEVVHSSKIKELISKQVISMETLVYNTAISNENELMSWEQPLKNTWLNKFVVMS